MSDTTLNMDLDPDKIISSLNDMAEKTKELAKILEDSLGKDATKSIKKFEEASENGTNRVGAFFKNLGNRVKEDLKTAFDIGKLASGLKMGQELMAGTKQVFEMERAFDRLNTRLGLSNKAMQDFKKNVGSKVAATGQKLEDVLPGVEVAAGKGSVKDSGQLTSIGEQLAKAKAITGEATDNLSDDIVDILHNQGQKVNSENFQQTLDALQATRTQGAFRTAGDAGNAMKELTHGLTPDQQRAMGLDTRTTGGLAAVASKSGEGGVGVLQKILQTGQSAGGKDLINSIFGSSVFDKQGKVSADGLKNINKNNLGQFSAQTMGEATGMDQAELARFIDSFKNNMDNFQGVVGGANETATQFGVATDNLVSKFEKFREQTKEAAREIGSELSQSVNSMFKGDIGGAISHLKDAGSNVLDNKGVVAGAIGTTIMGGLLMGGGMNGLLSKIPGGGMLGKLAGGAAADAAGVQKVYVVNAGEMSGGGGGLAGGAAKGIGLIPGAGLALAAGTAAIYGASWAASKYQDSQQGDAMADAEKSTYAKSAGSFNERNGMQLTPEQYQQAVENGTLKAMMTANKNKPTTLINPSTVKGQGAQH